MDQSTPAATTQPTAQQPAENIYTEICGQMIKEKSGIMGVKLVVEKG